MLNETLDNLIDFECFVEGICLENVGVVAMDSRDQYHRGRFFPFGAEQHLYPYEDPGFWYWSYVYYNTTDVSTIPVLL